MKKNILLIAFAFVVSAAFIGTSVNSAKSYTDGAPSTVTGSPGDNNKSCAKSGCHPGTATAIVDVITCDVPVTGYQPDSIYTITATITDVNLVKFGFEISPQSTDGTLLGTMALSDLTNTKFTSSANKYITHTNSGSSFPNHTASWSFSWTAPVVNTGDVTFYGAFDFADDNGSTSGDIINTSTLTIPEAFGVGVTEATRISSLNIFPNPATDYIHITYYLNQQQPVSISLFDLSGAQQVQFINETQPAGTHNTSLPLDEIKAGLYMIRLNAGNQSYSGKVIKL